MRHRERRGLLHFFWWCDKMDPNKKQHRSRNPIHCGCHHPPGRGSRTTRVGGVVHTGWALAHVCLLLLLAVICYSKLLLPWHPHHEPFSLKQPALAGEFHHGTRKQNSDTHLVFAIPREALIKESHCRRVLYELQGLGLTFSWVPTQWNAGLC